MHDLAIFTEALLTTRFGVIWNCAVFTVFSSKEW